MYIWFMTEVELFAYKEYGISGYVGASTGAEWRCHSPKVQLRCLLTLVVVEL